jgi:thiamine-phosphate pyrophosphorylase
MIGALAPRLYAITDFGRGSVESTLAALEALVRLARPGSVVIQLRDRELPILTRRRLGEVLRDMTRRGGQFLLVNDRLDLALLLGADGVHLGEVSVAAEDARAFAAAHHIDWFVTGACHAPEAFSGAQQDALLLSPVVSPRKGRPALGLPGLAAALQHRRERPGKRPFCALLALGGVTRHNARTLCQNGADGVAVLGEVLEPGGPEGLVAALDIER